MQLHRALLLALQASPGAEGLTLLSYFEGERTPDLPNARGSLHGATLTNFNRPNFARAVIEGTLASQVAMMDLLRNCKVNANKLMLIGGAAESPAVQTILSRMVDVPVVVPEFHDYVTKGAAMQAAAALVGSFPSWQVVTTELPTAPLQSQIADQHAAAKSVLGYEETKIEKLAGPKLPRQFRSPNSPVFGSGRTYRCGSEHCRRLSEE
jgi:xylulokinase